MLTHIDQKNQPTMVDVTDKSITTRVARAQTLIQLPVELKDYLKGEELILKKGPVFQTAIIAGTMAAKKTAELIPFCHQIPIESCKFNISMDENLLVTIECEVKTTSKTGVEMEALQGATSAALVIYDMCKAYSHHIVIKETKLISKTGGKRTILGRPTYGLVLTGGKSERMKQDKALINYKGLPHAQYIYDILKKYCDEVYFSARKEQWKDTPLEGFPTIQDNVEGLGPIGGILSAFDKHPDANWFVVACDLIYFNQKTVELLVANYNPNTVATTYINSEKGFPEPLCAIYNPEAKRVFEDAIINKILCPVRVLKNSTVHSIYQTSGVNLANINTPQELSEAKNEKH